MQANYFELSDAISVANAKPSTAQPQETSGHVLVYRGVAYVQQGPHRSQSGPGAVGQRSKDQGGAVLNTQLRYRGVAYTLATATASPAQTRSAHHQPLIYRGVAY